MPSKYCDGRSPEGGWALVSVLWAVVILAMLAASAQTLMLTAARTEARARDRDQADAVFNAAIARAVFGITDPQAERRWRVDGVAEKFKFGGYDIQLRITNELGKIDLNAADVSLLSRLLESAGVGEDEASRITGRIQDWRSASGLQGLGGGRDEDYQEAGKDYRPRHGPFQSIYELKLVLGMSPEIFERLRPAITVYSGRPMFDAHFAPVLVRRAARLNVSDEVSQADDSAGKLDLALTPFGQSFMIEAIMEKGDVKARREAVILLTGGKEPYLVRWWD